MKIGIQKKYRLNSYCKEIVNRYKFTLKYILLFRCDQPLNTINLPHYSSDVILKYFYMYVDSVQVQINIITKLEKYIVTKCNLNNFNFSGLAIQFT